MDDEMVRTSVSMSSLLRSPPVVVVVAPLVEGEDYYLENGLLIFTAHYHLRRGHCCGNRCRHCPYDWAAVPTAPTRREADDAD